jgi:ABC-type antimicrobial peptide transport system permease subunit
VLAIIATALFFIVGWLVSISYLTFFNLNFHINFISALLFSTIYMILTVNKKKRLAMAELEKYEKSSG